MQALILAAGSGSRLGKHTKENTKCMVKLNHKRLIDYILEILNHRKIKKLIIVVGYQKENLMNHVGTQYKNIKIEYIENPIYDKTNNIYSLFLAKDKLAQDDTILLESDLIFEEKILKRLLEDKRKSLAVVDKYQIWMDGTSVILDANDNILSFVTKGLFNFKDIDQYYKTVNIYKFSKEFSRKIYIPFLEAYSKAMGDNEYYESVLRVLTLLGDVELKALRLNGEKWYEIDDIQDKKNAEIIFAPSGKKKLDLIQSHYGGYWRFPNLKDFCYLVTPYFPPQKMQEEIKTHFYELLSQYPSGQEIQKLLAGKLFGIGVGNIVVGNGAAEIIRYLSTVIEGTVGLPFPTFNEYPECLGADRIVQFTPSNKDFSYSLKDMIELSKKCDNLLLINPDNPSGNFISKNDLLMLANELLRSGKNFILDESFVDFSSKGEEESLLTQTVLDRYPNLVIIKSISKSYGIPGLRLGILATSNTKIISAIQEKMPIWNINSLGEFFLQIIGKYLKEYKEGCIKLSEERNRFYKKLQNISFLRVIPSQANYFLVHVIDRFSARELTELLLFKYNIYVKDLTGKKGFEEHECIRISVRNSDDNTLMINVLQQISERS